MNYAIPILRVCLPFVTLACIGVGVGAALGWPYGLALCGLLAWIDQSIHEYRRQEYRR